MLHSAPIGRDEDLRVRKTALAHRKTTTVCYKTYLNKTEFRSSHGRVTAVTTSGAAPK